MNHGIVGMVGDDVAKVRCNTCQSEHAYKHGRLPKRRRGETDRLFAEVLRGIRGEPDASGADAEADPDEDAERSQPGPRAADEEREERPAPRAARGRDRDEEAEEDTDAETDGAAGDEPEDAPREPEETQPPVEPEDHPAHGVRRRLFTIRRHSGGKAPVEGVSTDIGRPGGPVTGNRPQQPAGGRGGRQQQGRWPRRHGRRR